MLDTDVVGIGAVQRLCC